MKKLNKFEILLIVLMVFNLLFSFLIAYKLNEIRQEVNSITGTATSVGMFLAKECGFIVHRWGLTNPHTGEHYSFYNVRNNYTLPEFEYEMEGYFNVS